MRFAKDLWREILDDNLLDGAAVVAYFFLLAVFPAALFVLSLLPSLSVAHLPQAILDLLHQVLPEQSANLFEVTVKYVASNAGTRLLTFGSLFTLWSASTGAVGWPCPSGSHFAQTATTSISTRNASLAIRFTSTSVLACGAAPRYWAHTSLKMGMLRVSST